MSISAYPQGTLADPPDWQPPTSAHPRRAEWWFRLTAPQEPEHATCAQREAVRRGRLASVTILFISSSIVL